MHLTMHLTLYYESTCFYSLWELIFMKYHFDGYISMSILYEHLIGFKFDLKEGFMHIFVKYH